MAGLPSELRKLGLWLIERVTSEPGISQTTVRSDVAPVWLFPELVGWPYLAMSPRWRPGLSVAKQPASEKRHHLRYDLEDIAQHSARIGEIAPELR